jgi:hypothetical protein
VADAMDVPDEHHAAGIGRDTVNQVPARARRHDGMDVEWTFTRRGGAVAVRLHMWCERPAVAAD